MLRLLGILALLGLLLIGLFWWPGWISHPVNVASVQSGVNNLATSVANLGNQVSNMQTSVNAVATAAAQAKTTQATPAPATTPAATATSTTGTTGGNTATPTGSTSTTYQGGIDPNCPTLQAWRNAVGVDVTLVGNGEPCAATFNTGDGSGKTIVLPQGDIVEWAQPDSSGGVVHVVAGDGTTKVTAKAATWRWTQLYPGLTVDSACTLLKNYAAAPQNRFVSSIVCGTNEVRDSASTSSSATTTACSDLNIPGGTVTSIDGGCLWKGATDHFVVPKGFTAHWGIPARDSPAGTDIGAQSQVSLYPAS